MSDVFRDEALEALLTQAAALAESDVRAGRDLRVPRELPEELQGEVVFDHYEDCWIEASVKKGMN